MDAPRDKGIAMPCGRAFLQFVLMLWTFQLARCVNPASRRAHPMLPSQELVFPKIDAGHGMKEPLVDV